MIVIYQRDGTQHGEPYDHEEVECENYTFDLHERTGLLTLKTYTLHGAENKLQTIVTGVRYMRVRRV